MPVPTLIGYAVGEFVKFNSQKEGGAYLPNTRRNKAVPGEDERS